jgi:hypothetical protein
MLKTLSKRALGVALVIVIAGVSVLFYCAFFPPLEFKIIIAVSSPLLVKGVTFYELAYSVSYTNRGVFDLTISGEIQTKIEGIREVDARAIGEKTISQPRFLLRVGETSSWVISVGVYETEFTPRNSLKIRLEAIAFLKINGMERTLTANYQFTGP